MYDIMYDIIYMISYAWCFCANVQDICHMISWYDITIYDIIGVQVFFGFIFGYLCIKKYKMPLADARTRTLICTLKGSQSNHCTNGSLHYTIPLLLIIYTHFMKARHVGAWTVPPVQTPSAPKCPQAICITLNGVWYLIWYHILISYIAKCDII